MVKKLFKHEFLAHLRIMGVVYVILLTIAGAGRLIQCFEQDNIPYKIVSSASILTYCVSVMGAFAFTFVLAIVRFYKNLFTAEGYLSFTLPVTPTQHILVKSVTAVAMANVSMLAVLLSVCIVTAGEVLVEVWKAFAYLLRKVTEVIGGHTALFSLELLLWLLIASFSGLLLYYTCIAVGQMFKKNRILSAVGVYFIYYIFTQIISTIFVVVFSAVSLTEGFQRFLLQLGQFIQQHPYVFIHSCLWTGIVLTAAYGLVMFLVTRRIITRKLNLE